MPFSRERPAASAVGSATLDRSARLCKQVNACRNRNRDAKRTVRSERSDSAEGVVSDSGKNRKAAIAGVLALLGSLGLISISINPIKLHPRIPDSVAVPSQSIQRPEKRYAGPAAFAFTLENAALSPDGRVTAWSYGGNDLVMCLGVWGGSGARPFATNHPEWSHSPDSGIGIFVPRPDDCIGKRRPHGQTLGRGQW